MSNQAQCEKCSTVLVPVTERKSLTFSGVIGVLLFFVGLLTLIGNLIIGVLLIIFGLVISFSAKRKITVMKCPSCGRAGRKL